MNQIADGWEPVSRQTNEPIWLSMTLVQIALPFPEVPRSFSTVTWTLRETRTGSVHKVTAGTKQEGER
jgi:hypothetical protein